MEVKQKERRTAFLFQQQWATRLAHPIFEYKPWKCVRWEGEVSVMKQQNLFWNVCKILVKFKKDGIKLEKLQRKNAKMHKQMDSWSYKRRPTYLAW